MLYMSTLITFLLPELMLRSLCNPIVLPVPFNRSPSPPLPTCASLCHTPSLPPFHFLRPNLLSLSPPLSKALMDFLVELCSQFHLNPAEHTLELFSPEGHTLGFKPNALLGSLNVVSVLIKKKVLEEKVVRRPAAKVPEVSKDGDDILMLFSNHAGLFL